MSNLSFAAIFTKTVAGESGVPATGLTLAEIDLFLTRQHRDTLADDVVWGGTQNPTDEMANVARYVRLLAGADLDTYHYYGYAQYTGADVLDSDYSHGALGKTVIFPAGAIEWPYIVTNSVSAAPLFGADVWVTTDIAGANPPVWRGTTDVNGAARDVFNVQPWLDAGVYYFWRQLVGYTFSNPDTETVA